MEKRKDFDLVLKKAQNLEPKKARRWVVLKAVERESQ
jgi:hypothetical protein